MASNDPSKKNSTKAADKLKAVTDVQEPPDTHFHINYTMWTYNKDNKDIFEWNFGSQATDLRVLLNTSQASTVEIDLEDDDYTVLDDPLFAHWAWHVEDVSQTSTKKHKALDILNFTGTSSNVYLGDAADPEWVLGENPIDFGLGPHSDDILFRLCGIQTQQTLLTLTLEDRSATLLRDKKGHKSWDRSQHTRAQFVAMLCKEAGVDYWIPEIDVKQPVGHGASSASSTDPVLTQASKAVAKGNKNLTVKGSPILAVQRQVAGIIINAGAKVGAPSDAVIAVIFDSILESGLGVDTQSNGAYGGVLGGPMDVFKPGLVDAEAEAIAALKGLGGPPGGPSSSYGGYGSYGGAIKLANQFPGKIAEIGSKTTNATPLDSNGISTQYEAENVPGGLPGVVAEAQAIFASGGGTASTTAGTPSQTGSTSYAFTRGANEDSWDAIQRLASEVGWYAFVRDNRLWFVSGNYLFSQDPQLTVERGVNGVDYIDIDLDMGERDQIAQCQVYCRAEMWTALPGMVVDVVRRGPASGRWIVASTEIHSLDPSTYSIVTLQKPIPKRAEPAAAPATPKGQQGTGSKAFPTKGGLTSPAPNNTPGRLDMGVDGCYDMSLGCHAPYDGKIGYGPDTGWPGEGLYFHIVNDDQSGPNYTRAMYFAEGATPCVPNGAHVTAGQKIGNAVAAGGNGHPGNYEIGPASLSGDCLVKAIGIGSAAAEQCVLDFAKWLEGVGMTNAPEPGHMPGTP